MREAVIVSTARTPIGKAYRGAFNDTQAQTLGGHVIASALKRASVEGGEVDDVVMGAALQQGSQGGNVARQSLLRAGLPTSVAGMSVDRQCASGLMAIAIAAKEIVDDGMSVTVGGGVESISLVQNDKMNRTRVYDPWLVEHRDDVYMSMLETAEIVAQRYKISRERQDEYGAQSQARAAAGVAAGRFDAELAPLPSVMKVVDKATGAVSDKAVTLKHDEGIRADTTLHGLAALKPVFTEGLHLKQPGENITAGNASQLSDGASACVLMEARAREPAQPHAARDLSRHRGRRLRPGRDGHWPGLRRAEALEGARPQGRRHRPLGTERSVRGPGHLLPRQARHRQ